MSPGPDPDPDGKHDDAALLAAHVAGDPAAFGKLFARHRGRLWAVALRTTGNPEDAADALQDALISAFKRAESFRGDSAVTTWLHRIVVNACLDRLRRAKVRLADPFPEDVEERATLDPVAGPTGDPEALAIEGDRRQRVLAALDELHADQKAALVLVDMEGYPVQEAARILEVPPGTIKSRCARGRARLAVLLADLDTSADPTTGTANGPAASYSGDRPRGARPTADPPGPAQRSESRDQPHRHADPREEVSGHE